MIHGGGGSYSGLSTDTKPTPPNVAAWFIETDTDKVYIWNSVAWVEKASAGGSVADGDKGDITVTGSGATWTIDVNVISDTKLRDSSALSVIGRSANSSGDPADIAAGSDGDVLRRSGTTLGFGTIPESSVTSLVSDLAGKVPTTRTITATAPIRIDAGASADLSANRTISITSYAGGAAGAVPAGAGSTTKFLREDATWAAPPFVTSMFFPFFGDGLDGPLTFDGTTTVLGIVPASNVYVLTKDISGTTITINSGVSIRFAGYRMMATVSITNNGTKVGNYGPDASGVSAGGGTGSGVIAGSPSGVAGKVGPGVGTAGTASGGVYTGWATLAAAAGGATGGTGQGSGGGAAGANAGGTGGALTQASTITGRFSLKAGMTGEAERGATQFTWGSSGGAGGVVGGTNGGSGGTGGGGSLSYIAAPLITGTGRFTSKGGDAGAGALNNSTGCGGSAGSGGGWMVVVYANRTGSLTIDADGGTGAAGVGTGNAGPNGGPGTVTLINVSGNGT